MAVEERQQDPPEAQVADPEEYNQTQRLRAINQARQRVEDTIEQSMVRERTDLDFDEGDRQQVVRAAVYSFISNIFWLMHRAEETDLIHTVDLGDVQINPPEELVEIAENDDTGYPRIIGKQTLQPHTIPIHGIRDYLSAPEIFQHEWSLTIERRHEKEKTITRTAETYMPVHVSQNAFHAANGFLSRAGFDAELHEKEHRAVIDEEVLSEVEQWRKQNIK